jgi:cytochrome c oxidase subunit 2
MASRRGGRIAVTLAAAGLAIGAAACGSDLPEVQLSDAAAAGRSLMMSSGCAACHGSDGGGGVGPAFVGLFMSDRPLSNGTIVTADRDYLVESIMMPGMKQVEDYSLPMPSNSLTRDEVDLIVGYIVELATPGTTP